MRSKAFSACSSVSAASGAPPRRPRPPQKQTAFWSEKETAATPPAVKNPAHVVAGKDGTHARSIFRVRRIDACNARVRIGTSQALCPERAGQQHVRSVARFAGDFSGV